MLLERGKKHFLLHQAISIKMPEHTKLGIGRSLLHAAVLCWTLSGKWLWSWISGEAGNPIVCTYDFEQKNLFVLNCKMWWLVCGKWQGFNKYA